MILDKRVDLPTEGNPTRAMRASGSKKLVQGEPQPEKYCSSVPPDLLTSKPVPPPPPLVVGSRSCARNRASFLFR